jgi:aminoglycoside phosphotransferase (APT) family kinase protein
MDNDLQRDSLVAVEPDFERLVRRIEPQGKLLRAWQLAGGVSARVTGLEIEQADGHKRRLVVRQHGEADLRANPRIAADEFRLLQGLEAAGLAVPMPYYVDESGEILATPYVVIEFVEGEAEFEPHDLGGLLAELAAQLASVHRVDGSNTELSFLPQQEARVAEKLANQPDQLDESLSEGRIREALEAAWPWPQRNPSVLLHGDFWPGNLLWRDGRLVAVLDWEDAAVGDPLADVANSRLEVLWAFGSEAMERFTRHYHSLMTWDFANLPYWDLWAALRPASKLSGWGLDEVAEKAMREQHRWFVEQALGKVF